MTSVITNGAGSTYYELLQVHPAAPLDLITASYWVLANELSDGEDFSGRLALHRLMKAYEVLANPVLRARHDSLLGIGSPSAAAETRQGIGLGGRLLATVLRRNSRALKDIDCYELLRVDPRANAKVLSLARAVMREYYLRLVRAGAASPVVLDRLEAAYGTACKALRQIPDSPEETSKSDVRQDPCTEIEEHVLERTNGGDAVNLLKTKSAPHFASIDSAPPGYAVARSPWVVFSFLVAFSAAAGALLLLSGLNHSYATALSTLTSVNVAPPDTLAFRPFFVAFASTFWFFAAGNVLQRMRLMLCVVICVVTSGFIADVALVGLREAGGPGPFSLVGDLTSGYAMLLALTGVIVFSVLLPGGEIVHPVHRQPRRYMYTLFFAVAFTVLIVAITLAFANDWINAARDAAVLGGLGPGLLLFSPILACTMFALAIAFRRRTPKLHACPAVAFLVPALNEADHIAACIRSLEAAAAEYGGPCTLYVVDNGSTDGTREIAEREMENCQALSGKVLRCATPGKARALNLGLRESSEEILVRVDADTSVLPSLLTMVVPYFSDPLIGGVGGLPLPRDTSFLLAKMRAVEVYYNVAFQRVAQSAVDAVTVIPGILSAYRRDLLVQLGGFSEGINGEDTDMTVRVGRLGYGVVVAPEIRIYSEVPRNLSHLREQRLRWSRSFLHVFARNRSAIWMLQGARGVWTLPTAFVAVFRRAVVVPVLVYAALVTIIEPSALFLRHGAAVGAVLAGPALLMTIIVLALHRRLDLLPFIPAYLVLRFLRAFFTLEMLFTLPLKAGGAAHGIPVLAGAGSGGAPTTRLPSGTAPSSPQSTPNGDGFAGPHAPSRNPAQPGLPSLVSTSTAPPGRTPAPSRTPAAALEGTPTPLSSQSPARAVLPVPASGSAASLSDPGVRWIIAAIALTVTACTLAWGTTIRLRS